MFYDYSKFCSNEHCVPHVSSQDENVEGNGQWATLPNGIMFARMLGDGRYYTALHSTPRSEPCSPPLKPSAGSQKRFLPMLDRNAHTRRFTENLNATLCPARAKAKARKRRPLTAMRPLVRLPKVLAGTAALGFTPALINAGFKVSPCTLRSVPRWCGRRLPTP